MYPEEWEEKGEEREGEGKMRGKEGKKAAKVGGEEKRGGKMGSFGLQKTLASTSTKTHWGCPCVVRKAHTPYVQGVLGGHSTLRHDKRKKRGKEEKDEKGKEGR